MSTNVTDRTATSEPVSDSNAPRPVSAWRSVAVPTEHGGWSLTAEPALLGLVVAWSWSGLAVSIAAVLAFMARTPIKMVLVDRWRGRWLGRSAVASKVAAVEVALIVALAALAVIYRTTDFWIPLLVGAPFLILELYFDMRSKSRHLIPELAGAIGIGAVGTAVALAGGAESHTAWGLWVVMAARSVSAIPYVRTQIARAKQRSSNTFLSDGVQLGAIAAMIGAYLANLVPIAGVIVISLFCTINIVAVRLRPRRAVVIGVQQTLVGLSVIAVTAAAIHVG